MARKSFDVHRNSFSRGKNTFDDGDEKRAKNIQEMTNEDDTETKDDTNKNQPKKSVDGSAVVVYPNSRAKLSPRDTFLTHGCSQALSHAIQVLAKNADEEMAILVNNPSNPCGTLFAER